jgi:hypothetical protein
LSFNLRTHFSSEISNNKIVRFIYQGQFLNDKSTIKSYNIRDQTTIHCHITSKLASGNQQQQQAESAALDLRDNSPGHSESTLGGSTRQAAASSFASSSGGGETLTNSSSTESENASANAAAEIMGNEGPMESINLHLNHLLLPFFAILLGTCWYFRINFKHFFSPLSTLILVIFTFLYALFLFNNIHSTSSYAVNSFLLQNRLLHQQHRGREATPSPSP